MYPVYGLGVLGVGERCRLICAVNACVVLVRTITMEVAVKAMEKFLAEFYSEESSSALWQLPLTDAVTGAMCIVFRHGRVKRGEIVCTSTDDDDSIEVYLVDDGDSVFVRLADLRKPHPLAASMPVLSMTCTVHGLDHIYIDGTDVVLEAIGRRKLLVVREKQASVGGQPPVVRFSTVEDEDLAYLVLEQVGPTDGDDEGFGDCFYGAAAFEARDPRGRKEENDNEWKEWIKSENSPSSSDEELDDEIKDLVIDENPKISDDDADHSEMSDNNE